MTAIGNAGAGFPAVKFQKPGDNHWGTIIKAVDMQSTDFKTRKPQFYEDGNPVLQTVITIQKSDESYHRIFVKAGAMRSACTAAVVAAQADDIEPGGMIKITFLGMEPAKGGGERKAYRANYKKPEPGWVAPEMPGSASSSEFDDDAFGEEPPF